jgi:hypothetical protein
MHMSATALADAGFEVSDVTGQKVLAVSNVPDDVTIGDLIQGLVGRMRLPANDAAGRPLSYHARLDREGRHLQGAERVRESLQPGDRIVLQPNVDAGAGGRSAWRV